jgi:hypothetical protein
MIAVGLVLAASLSSAPAPSAPACPAELFRIARSKNANVVVYEARRSGTGSLDPREPLQASWLLLAQHGEREDLNFIERLLAYGFDVRPARQEAGWSVTLKALKDRPVRLVELDGCPRALWQIAGRQGVLRKVYVKADERHLIPPVEYVDVFGVDPRSGEELYERILGTPPEPERYDPFDMSR